MRSYRRSYLSSFLYGVLIATGTAGGLMGTHMMLAPPAPDQQTAQAPGPEVAATTSAGVEKWARQSQPAPKSEAPLPATKAALVPAPTEPKLVAGPIPAASGESQRALTRNIQRELKRVGCYGGEVTGDWSGDTRAAMKAFNETVRVQFPVTGPDYILLTLLQGQSTRACGAQDPSIMAKVPAPKQVTRQQVVRDPTVVVPEPRTVTIVQPKPSTGVAQLPPSVAPAPTVAALPEPLSIPTAAPLPGRMGIGAPVPRPEVVAPVPAPLSRAAVSPGLEQQAEPAEPRLVSPPRPAERKAATPSRPGSGGYTPPPRAARPAPSTGQGLFTSLNRAAP